MSQTCSKLVNSAFFGGHFCYHSNSKSQINTRLLHLSYCSNKVIKKNLVFSGLIGGGGGGGQNSPIMHLALYYLFLVEQ